MHVCITQREAFGQQFEQNLTFQYTAGHVFALICPACSPNHDKWPKVQSMRWLALHFTPTYVDSTAIMPPYARAPAIITSIKPPFIAVPALTKFLWGVICNGVPDNRLISVFATLWSIRTDVGAKKLALWEKASYIAVRLRVHPYGSQLPLGYCNIWYSLLRRRKFNWFISIVKR